MVRHLAISRSWNASYHIMFYSTRHSSSLPSLYLYLNSNLTLSLYIQTLGQDVEFQKFINVFLYHLQEAWLALILFWPLKRKANHQAISWQMKSDESLLRLSHHAYQFYFWWYVMLQDRWAYYDGGIIFLNMLIVFLSYWRNWIIHHYHSIIHF